MLFLFFLESSERERERCVRRDRRVVFMFGVRIRGTFSSVLAREFKEQCFEALRAVQKGAGADVRNVRNVRNVGEHLDGDDWGMRIRDQINPTIMLVTSSYLLLQLFTASKPIQPTGETPVRTWTRPFALAQVATF